MFFAAERQDAPVPSSLTHTPSSPCAPAKSFPEPSSISSALACLPARPSPVTAQAASRRSRRSTPLTVARKSRVAGALPCVSCWPFGDRSAVSVIFYPLLSLDRQSDFRRPAPGLAAIIHGHQRSE